MEGKNYFDKESKALLYVIAFCCFVIMLLAIFDSPTIDKWSMKKVVFDRETKDAEQIKLSQPN
jgi:MFS-type transporter involved in bile tolerance (Atg22 family)